MKGETSSLSSPRGWWSTFPLQQCRRVPTQGEQAALSRPRDQAVSGSQRRGFQVAVAIPGCWGSEICGGLARLLSEAHDCKTDNSVKLTTCIISKCTLQMMWVISQCTNTEALTINVLSHKICLQSPCTMTSWMFWSLVQVYLHLTRCRVHLHLRAFCKHTPTSQKHEDFSFVHIKLLTLVTSVILLLVRKPFFPSRYRSLLIS